MITEKTIIHIQEEFKKLIEKKNQELSGFKIQYKNDLKFSHHFGMIEILGFELCFRIEYKLKTLDFNFNFQSF